MIQPYSDIDWSTSLTLTLLADWTCSRKLWLTLHKESILTLPALEGVYGRRSQLGIRKSELGSEL